jgi:hypothetical protein
LKLDFSFSDAFPGSTQCGIRNNCGQEVLTGQ